MRQIEDINALIDIMSSIQGGCYATVCYLSSARVKKTLRNVDKDKFGADLDQYRTEGDDENYETLKQYQSGVYKKFPYNGVVKMSRIQFHWLTEKNYGKKYGEYADARDTLIRKYGGEPQHFQGTDARQAYGNGDVSVGSTENTQGRLYSHQNGASAKWLDRRFYLVDTNGNMKGGVDERAIEALVAKKGDPDGVSALKKVNASDEVIKQYVAELKALKFNTLKLMYDSILFIVASVDGEKIFFWNKNLAQRIGSSGYEVNINPKSFKECAKEVFSDTYEELQHIMIESTQRTVRLTESELYKVIKESVTRILKEEAGHMYCKDDEGNLPSQ